MLRTAVAVVLLVLLSAVSAAAAPTNTKSIRVNRLEEWLRALADHVPGEIDAPLQAFASWSQGDWQRLVEDAQLFTLILDNPGRMNVGLRTLIDRRRAQPTLDPLSIDYLRQLSCGIRELLTVTGACVTGGTALDPTLERLAARDREARTRNDTRYIPRLAILLHTELIVWGGTQSAMATRLAFGASDGQGSGASNDTMHWAIAYGVLDALAEQRGDRTPTGWIRDWYVASALLMQLSGRSDQFHIERALRAFPDDADVRFVSACQHEIDASPVIQQALQAVTASLPKGASTSIGTARKELEAAESDLRAVVARRSEWGEAHLRLGRVLSLLGKRRESESHLQRALTLTADDAMLQYLAALFLGASHEQAERFDRARASYAQAGALFPSAPSAQLALSQLSRRQGDGEAAYRALEGLLSGATNQQTIEDPWWQYLTLQARAVTAWLQRLHTASTSRLQ